MPDGLLHTSPVMVAPGRIAIASTNCSFPWGSGIIVLLLTVSSHSKRHLNCFSRVCTLRGLSMWPTHTEDTQTDHAASK